jgi:ribonuclease-3
MEPALALAARIGLQVRNPDLLSRALVHASYVNEHPESPLESNARLEFLGDAVVALVISQTLYERHPGEDEGGLTARRAAVVSTTGLARLAQRIGLESSLTLGQGAERSGERRRISVLAAAFEAVVGAAYLDVGLEAVRAWLLAIVADELDAAAPLASLKSPKSRLQELGYGRWGAAPEYQVVSAEGPDHLRHYVVEVTVAGEVLGRGEGGSRRLAETEAAAEAVARLESGGGPGPVPVDGS